MRASERPTIKKVIKEVNNHLKQCKVGKISISFFNNTILVKLMYHWYQVSLVH